MTYYALVYILGFLAVLVVLLRASRKKEINLTESQVYNLVILMVIGVLVGARIFHIVFWGLGYYLKDPVRMLYIWQGGFSFHGGLVGTIIALALYSRKSKARFFEISDIMVLPAILFLAIGRIVCFINQGIVGRITDVPWCFKFKYSEGCRHPVTLYISAIWFSLFGLLVYVKKKLKSFKVGFLSWIFVALVGAERFLTDFFREGEKHFGLLTGQWFGIIMIVIGGYVLFAYYKKDVKRIFMNKK